MAPLLLLLPVVLRFATADAIPASCSNATCAGVEVLYPFTLNSSGSQCGYPGLGLACENNASLILTVQSHRYKVVGINYFSNTVAISDADLDEYEPGCPRLHWNLTIDYSSSWLQLAPSNSNITVLYNCKKNISRSFAVELLGCRGGYDKRSYMLRDGVAIKAYEYECEELVVAPVLTAHKTVITAAPGAPPVVNGSLYDEVVKAGFELTYHPNSRDCNACERSGGWCGYRLNQTEGGMAFTCYSDDCSTSGRCGRHNKSRIKIYIIASASCLLLLGLIIFALYMTHKYVCSLLSETEGPTMDTPSIESFLQKNGNIHPKRYTYTEVKRMTKSFAVKLGQGGFGEVYRGNLPDGREVAVKMLKDTKGDGKEFMNEVSSISRTSHVNVVSLLGYCLEGPSWALLYEYMPNGSLERYAFNNNISSENTLTWEKLFEITIGIARGLEYLHRGCNTRIVHFDIKPHNILLDEDFCPKISDFGLAKLCLNKESIISIAGARGTIGYIAPQVYSKQFGTVSSKSDVYSYGMMVLEMVGARDKKNNANTESSSQYFPQWIYEHLDDYCICSSEISSETTELVRKMIVVGLWCIQVSPTYRPTMTRVVEMLEGSTSTLELPPKTLLTLS